MVNEQPRTREGDGRAHERILEVAREEIIRAGWAAATSGRVAQRTGVSKALIHYHFPDKDALLCAVATQCLENAVARRTGVAEPKARPNPVDGFEDWLERELVAGDLRIALHLKASGRESVVRAADAVIAAIRAAIQEEAGRVFGTLGMTPRLPERSIIDLLMAVAVAESLAPALPASRRRTVESLWLSLLSVAE
jgi:AcrR family transcriptional regulator